MGSQSVTASNTGTAALTVSQVQISGTGFALSGITAPVSLTPAQSQSFSVTFDSSTTGTVTGKLTLMTSAADERAGSASLISPAAAGTTWAFASPATGRNSAASRWRRSTSTVGAKSGASSAVSGSGKR
jgi:hypothetical protein